MGIRMVPVENGEKEDDSKEQPTLSKSSNSLKLKDFLSVDISTSGKELLDRNHRKKRFLDFLKAHPSKDWFLKSGFVGRISPFTFLRRNGSQRDDPVLPDPAPGGRWRRFHVPFVRKINWEALIRYCKNWVKHPTNIALLVWLFFVAVGLVALFLLMTGLLNGLITDSGIRKRWTEIANQIVNALFTIMCLYQHPRLLYQFVLLCRWGPSDAAELRKLYCKDGTPRPKDRVHMMYVVLLLHFTCFVQYGYCALYWGFNSETRPDWPQYLLIFLGTAAPIIAGVYTVYGPLGRKLEYELDEEAQNQVDTAGKPEVFDEKKYGRRVLVTEPEWAGGLFDCHDDPTVGCLSFFCTFCVFGWNMERLGFGNMYVHVFTFMLLCVAPFWVFSIAVLNINDEAMRYMVGISGIVLSFLGLFYGGFWRAQMRRRFKLPASTLFADFMRWLFCWSCALSQEVRTGNFYEIDEDSVYRKEAELENGQQPVLAPLPRENGAEPVIRASFSSPSSQRTPEMVKDDELLALSVSINEEMMTPPLPTSIQVEDRQSRMENQ